MLTQNPLEKPEAALAEDLLCGMPSIARHLGRTERATYHLHYKKLIPTFKMGGVIYARKSELEAAFRSTSVAA